MNYFRDVYYDNEGNPIKSAKDIVVTNLSHLGKDYYDVNSDLYGSGEKFGSIHSNYINRQTKEQYDIICSKRTKEIIPFDCLNKPTYTILLCGIQSVGKTTAVVQYIVECPDIISSGGNVSVSNALDQKKLPKEISANVDSYLRRQKPSPTSKTIKDGCESILFYVDSDKDKAAVKLLDVPGEVALSGASAYFDHCDAIFLYVDLSDPVTDEEKILFQLQNDRITQLKNCKNISNSIPIYVILTKADKLKYKMNGENRNLSKEIPNSICINEYGKKQLAPKYHMDRGGYDYESYRATKEQIERYLNGNHAGIAKALRTAFGENLRFFISGNYMKDFNGQIPQDVTMYRVEQPLLHFMADNDLYPGRNKYGKDHEPVPTQKTWEKNMKRITRFLGMILE